MIASVVLDERVVTIHWTSVGWTYLIEDSGVVSGEGSLSAPAWADFGMLVEAYNQQVGGGFNEFVCVLRRVPMHTRSLRID